MAARSRPALVVSGGVGVSPGFRSAGPASCFASFSSIEPTYTRPSLRVRVVPSVVGPLDLHPLRRREDDALGPARRGACAERRLAVEAVVVGLLLDVDVVGERGAVLRQRVLADHRLRHEVAHHVGLELESDDAPHVSHPTDVVPRQERVEARLHEDRPCRHAGERVASLLAPLRRVDGEDERLAVGRPTQVAVLRDVAAGRKVHVDDAIGLAVPHRGFVHVAVEEQHGETVTVGRPSREANRALVGEHRVRRAGFRVDHDQSHGHRMHVRRVAVASIVLSVRVAAHGRREREPTAIVAQVGHRRARDVEGVVHRERRAGRRRGGPAARRRRARVLGEDLDARDRG